MNDDRVETDELHQNDIEGKVLLELLIHHGVPPVFDHDRGILEALDIGEGLNQNLRPIYLFSSHSSLPAPSC